MSRQAKLNLVGIALLPLAAVLSTWISGQNGVFNPYSATYITIFAMNGGLMVVAGVISGLFLLGTKGEFARFLVVLPTLVPAVWGTLWYLSAAISPAEVAAGAEYIGAPQLLLMAVIGFGCLAFLVWLTGLFRKSS
ncbi:MAG: hypothetical protein ACR2P6_07605 [Gammaproteobacteria bacterium]